MGRPVDHHDSVAPGAIFQRIWLLVGSRQPPHTACNTPFFLGYLVLGANADSATTDATSNTHIACCALGGCKNSSTGENALGTAKDIEQAGFARPFLGPTTGSFPRRTSCWVWRPLVRAQEPSSLRVLLVLWRGPCRWRLGSMSRSVRRPIQKMVSGTISIWTLSGNQL